MAITFDAASNSGYATGGTLVMWSHTTAGANRFVAVDVAILNAVGVSVSGITYGGVAMSLIGAKSTTSGAYTVESWGLVAPATAVQTVIVTLSATADAVGMAASYNGVHQSTPTEAYDSNQGTNGGAPQDATCVTNTTTATWGRLAIATSDGAVTALQTARNNVAGAAGSGADEDTVASDPNMGYTDVGAGETWAVGIYGMIPAPVASSGPTDSLMITPNPDRRATQIVFY